jgi:hypothetical protein
LTFIPFLTLYTKSKSIPILNFRAKSVKTPREKQWKISLIWE